MPRPDEPARDYWIRAGAGQLGPTTLSPGSRFAAWEELQRRLLQRWNVRLLRRVARRLPLRRAVDLGCGYGDFTLRLGALAAEIAALDYSPGLAREAAARLRGHPAAEVSCGDAREFDDYRSPELVSLGGVLLYMPDDDAQQLLHRVRARLAPGGLLLHREYIAAHDGDEGLCADAWASYRRPASRYRLWARQAGLRLITQRTFPAIFAEQAVFETIGLRLDGWSRLLSPIPSLLSRLVSSRRRACSWTALYAAPDLA